MEGKDLMREESEMPRGGKREGAGRKKHYPPLRNIEVSLTEEQTKLLRMWGRGSVSEGLRWLIEVAKDLVYKPAEKVDDPRSSG